MKLDFKDPKLLEILDIPQANNTAGVLVSRTGLQSRTTFVHVPIGKDMHSYFVTDKSIFLYEDTKFVVCTLPNSNAIYLDELYNLLKDIRHKLGKVVYVGLTNSLLLVLYLNNDTAYIDIYSNGELVYTSEVSCTNNKIKFQDYVVRTTGILELYYIGSQRVVQDLPN